MHASCAYLKLLIMIDSKLSRAHNRMQEAEEGYASKWQLLRTQPTGRY